MKTFLAASLVITITINLTSSWSGGFGFPAWVGLGAATLFVWGLSQAMADYKRLSRR